MKFRLLLVSLLTVLVNSIYAQDWQCIHDSTTAYFKNESFWTIRVDSVRESLGNKLYYSIRSPKIVTSYYNYTDNLYQCIFPGGSSRIGNYMIVGSNGNFFINAKGDSIRFITIAQPGDTWYCCRIDNESYLEASVSEITFESVLGVMDSVKIIAFQARSASGIPMNHPLNSEQFRLSKHLGLITLYDFRVFPSYPENTPVHLICGIHSPAYSHGDTKLSWKEVYSFSPGDEFHSKHTWGFGSNGSPEVNSTVLIVLDSSWNSTSDTVFYTMKRYNRYYDPLFEKYTYTCNFIKVSYGFDPEFSTQPEESCLIYDKTNHVNLLSAKGQYRSAEFNLRRQIKRECSAKEFVSPCADSLFSGHAWTPTPENFYTYVDGCGGPYYFHCDTNQYYYKWNCESNYLVYFKKGSETWGTPFNITGWCVNSVPESQTDAPGFGIMPNPVNENFRLSFDDGCIGDYRLEIYSIQGIKLDEFFVRGPDQTISAARYNKGVYLLKLYDQNKLIFQQKLIKI